MTRDELVSALATALGDAAIAEGVFLSPEQLLAVAERLLRYAPSGGLLIGPDDGSELLS